MLAKASSSRLFYRPGFDISFPLFHHKQGNFSLQLQDTSSKEISYF